VFLLRKAAGRIVACPQPHLALVYRKDSFTNFARIGVGAGKSLRRHPHRQHRLPGAPANGNFITRPALDRGTRRQPAEPVAFGLINLSHAITVFVFGEHGGDRLSMKGPLESGRL